LIWWWRINAIVMPGTNFTPSATPVYSRLTLTLFQNRSASIPNSRSW
jgi:hypothetical protein